MLFLLKLCLNNISRESNWGWKLIARTIADMFRVEGVCLLSSIILLLTCQSFGPACRIVPENREPRAISLSLNIQNASMVNPTSDMTDAEESK